MECAASRRGIEHGDPGAANRSDIRSRNVCHQRVGIEISSIAVYAFPAHDRTIDKAAAVYSQAEIYPARASTDEEDPGYSVTGTGLLMVNVPGGWNIRLPRGLPDASGLYTFTKESARCSDAQPLGW